MHSDKQVKIDGSASISYHAMVEKLVKKFPRFVELRAGGYVYMEDAQAAFDDMAYKLELCHLALGLATEASEAADILKAHAIYGKTFDRDALVKELGDLRFWIQDAQNKFNIGDHEIAQGNADKLATRYKNLNYTDTQAVARVDKRIVVADSPLDYAAGRFQAGPFEHLYEAQQAASEFYPTEADNPMSHIYMIPGDINK